MFFSQKVEHKVIQLPINKIKPNPAQPRLYFSEEELSSLSSSIRQNGILQPLTVRKTGQAEFELISGERRLRASKMAGLKSVPCIVMSCDDQQSAVFALLENLQRSDLNPFEEAEGIHKLITELGITQEETAIRLGKKQSTIANKLRLLRLSCEERDRITQAGLSERHARALLKMKEEEDRSKALDQIIAEGLNVQQTEQLVVDMLTKNQIRFNLEPLHRRVIIKDVRIFFNTIEKAIHTMQASGIDATAEQTETEEYLEYRVKIPKKEAIKKRLA